MKMLKSLLPLAVCALVFGITSFADASTGKVATDVSVEITAGDICIGATGSIDLGTYSVSSSAQTVNGTFTDEFWVDDLKGADSGYYTTLQLSGDLTDGTNTIPGANVSVKTATVGSAGITLMTGSANPLVEVDASMAAFQTLDSARTFIKRDTAPNSGLVGQYGAFPELQVVIPAYQAVGTYTATLCYTLYEN